MLSSVYFSHHIPFLISKETATLTYHTIVFHRPHATVFDTKLFIFHLFHIVDFPVKKMYDSVLNYNKFNRPTCVRRISTLYGIVSIHFFFFFQIPLSVAQHSSLKRCKFATVWGITWYATQCMYCFTVIDIQWMDQLFPKYKIYNLWTKQRIIISIYHPDAMLLMLNTFNPH